MRHIVINKISLQKYVVTDLTNYNIEEWLVNPDTSAVDNVLHKYWKIVENSIIEMTEEEKTALDTNILQQYMADKIFDLWSSTDEYNKKFFSGGIYSRILEMKLNGEQRAIDCEAWIDALWHDYYTRKYFLSIKTTVEEVDTISMDFTNNGNPPYTVAELLG